MFGSLLLLLALSQTELFGRLEVARVEDLARRLSEEVAQSPSGAGFASAVAGSPEERALSAVVAGELEALGLSVRREPFPVRSFEYGPVTLSADGTEVPAITLHSGGGTWGTWDGIPYGRGNGPEGRVVEAELVDAGQGLAPDYERMGSVAGKAVLVEWTSWPGFVILEAAARGAAAVILYDYPGASLEDALKQNTVIYHDAVPSVSISVASARTLADALGAGDVTVRLENRVDASYGFSENVVGIVRGGSFPEEWVSVSAHHDRWFRGAQDDAVGVAALVELARLVAEAPTSPRRSHLFVSFGAEETGGPDAEFDWLAGSYAFVKTHPEIVSRLVYGLNIDGAGWPGERGYLYGSLEMRGFHESLLETLGLSERIEMRSGVTDWVDAWSLVAVGGASSGYLLWFEAHGQDGGPDAFSPYYHTQFDRFGARPYENLGTDLRLAALALARLDAAEALPIELSEIARWVLESLDADEARLGALGESVGAEMDLARSAARRFLATALASEREGAPSEDIAIRNLRLLRTRRELVPWLLTVSSSAAVLRTAPHVNDGVALELALEAAHRGDAPSAARALEDVSTLGWGASLSEEAYRAERLMSFAVSDWSREFRQNPSPPAPDLRAVYEAVLRGEVSETSLSRIAAMRTEALERLREALFVIAGKLERAEGILDGDVVLGAPPVERVR